VKDEKYKYQIYECGSFDGYENKLAEVRAQLAVAVDALKKIHEWHIGDNPASAALVKMGLVCQK
jgi:hypothetical protein